MYKTLVLTDDKTIENECRNVLNRFIDVRTVVCSTTDIWSDNKDALLNYLAVITDDMSNLTRNGFKEILEDSAQIPIVIFNHSLAGDGLKIFSENPHLNLIIGDNRADNLYSFIEKAKDQYWRKIPLQRFGIATQKISPRIQQAISLIESEEMNQINSASIARALKISPGYFSQEFKRETGISFRTFLQQVLNYYEDIILSRFNLSANNISRLLGYSDLSSFSRSFKRRKGLSPSEYRKQSFARVNTLH